MSNGTPYVYNVTRRVRAALALIGYAPPRDAVQIALSVELPYCDRDRVRSPIGEVHLGAARAREECFEAAPRGIRPSGKSWQTKAERLSMSLLQEGKYRVYRMRYGTVGQRRNYSCSMWVVARGSACALFSSWDQAWHFLFEVKP